MISHFVPSDRWMVYLAISVGVSFFFNAMKSSESRPDVHTGTFRKESAVMEVCGRFMSKKLLPIGL